MIRNQKHVAAVRQRPALSRKRRTPSQARPAKPRRVEYLRTAVTVPLIVWALAFTASCTGEHPHRAVALPDPCRTPVQVVHVSWSPGRPVPTMPVTLGEGVALPPAPTGWTLLAPGWQLVPVRQDSPSAGYVFTAMRTGTALVQGWHRARAVTLARIQVVSC